MAIPILLKYVVLHHQVVLVKQFRLLVVKNNQVAALLKHHQVVLVKQFRPLVVLNNQVAVVVVKNHPQRHHHPRLLVKKCLVLVVLRRLVAVALEPIHALMVIVVIAHVLKYLDYQITNVTLSVHRQLLV